MYKYGFHVKEKSVYKAQKGLSSEVVSKISSMKNEPKWMHEFRQKAYKIFRDKPTPQWGGDLNKINYDESYYYLKPVEKEEGSFRARSDRISCCTYWVAVAVKVATTGRGFIFWMNGAMER